MSSSGLEILDNITTDLWTGLATAQWMPVALAGLMLLLVALVVATIVLIDRCRPVEIGKETDVGGGGGGRVVTADAAATVHHVERVPDTGAGAHRRGGCVPGGR